MTQPEEHVCLNGHQIPGGSRFCGQCGAPIRDERFTRASTSPGDVPPLPSPHGPPPSWHPDPEDPHSLRWWDGQRWTDHRTPRTSPAYGTPEHQAYLRAHASEKSSGLAILFTVLWAGTGHLYLGFAKKGTPHVIANAVGLALGLTGFLLPVTFVIWIVTLSMTIGSVNSATEIANEAARKGQRLVEE